MTLSEILKRRREQLRMSQSDVAKIAGVDQATYCDIENGVTRNPRARTFSGIARALQLYELVLLDMARGNVVTKGDVVIPETLITLLHEAQTLTPEQQEKATAFIKGMRASETDAQRQLPKLDS